MESKSAAADGVSGWINPSIPSTSVSAIGMAAGQSSSTTSWLEDPPYTVHVLDLPTEILEKIFLYNTYEQIGKIRRVCVRFNAIGSSLLNSGFMRLQTTMLQRFQQIKSQMPRRESARRNHPFARECDIVETVHMRLTLLQMSFGKHIERKHCCFFAGEILDEVYRIFRHVKSTPNLGRAYKVTDELFDLTTMAMEYFKEYIEPELPEITYFAADFLDCNSFSSTGIKPCAWKNTSPTGSPLNSSSPGPVDESQDLAPTNVLINMRIKRLRQGMRKNNGQVIILKRELKSNKSQMADQQKQLIEYGTRLEENDKKLEEYSRKYSSLLQELNKCKTEMQYWRSKSPANQPTYCANCMSTSDSNVVVVEKSSSHDIIDDEVVLGAGTTSTSISDNYEFVPIPLKTTVELSELISIEPCHSDASSLRSNDNHGTSNCNDTKVVHQVRSQLSLKRKLTEKSTANDDGSSSMSFSDEQNSLCLSSISPPEKRSKSNIVKCISSE